MQDYMLLKYKCSMEECGLEFIVNEKREKDIKRCPACDEGEVEPWVSTNREDRDGNIDLYNELGCLYPGE